MRISIVVLASCASASAPTPPPSYSSVRDRLAEPTRFYIGPDASSGSIDAERRTSDGWQAGTTAIAIGTGELVASIDAMDALLATTFDLAVDPIELPQGVFGQPAQLADVRVQLASRPPSTTASWTTEDAATATLATDLAISWSITIDGGNTPLGTLHLSSVPITVDVGGDGDHPRVTLGLHIAGALWGWAGLVYSPKLDLTLVGATVD